MLVSKLGARCGRQGRARSPFMTAAMTWELDGEHEEFRASVRAFVDRHVRPVVDGSEAAGHPPAALLKEMGSAGLLGLAVPEEYGGGAGATPALVPLAQEPAPAHHGTPPPPR